MKIHRLLIDQLALAIKDIFSTQHHAHKVIESYLKKNRKWGSRDRKFFAESVYDLIRWWRLYWSLAGYDDMDHRQGETMSPGQIERVWATYYVIKTQESIPWPEFQNIDLHQIAERRKKITNEGILLSYSEDLLKIFKAELKADWLTIAQNLNETADVYLRTNSLKTTRDVLAQRLREEEILVEKVDQDLLALRLSERKNVFISPAFKDGHFEVQDLGSQKIAPFLKVEPGQRVIDACAGAGGKSLHLACLMKNKGKIIALDIFDRKLEELRTRAKRNGIDIIETRLIENTKVIKRLEKAADRVLLDVPCSGLGVLRRNPDKKWKINSADIERLKALQWQILSTYSEMTKPGGYLVYATCSLLPSENELQVKRFLAEKGENWKLEEEIFLRPDKEPTDGFYAARLKRLQ